MAKRAKSIVALERIAKKLPATKPEKAHPLVYEAFKIAALAGDVPSARAVLHAMMELPPAKDVVHALSTHAIDVFCHVAGLGDLTHGRPTHRWALVTEGTLDERVRAIDRGARYRVTHVAYGDEFPKDDAWQKKKPGNPQRTIDRWLRIQLFAHPDHATKSTELEALARLEELLADWPRDERGAGYGQELVLAFELAFRFGREAKASEWLVKHGFRVREESLEDVLLCFPAIAARMAEGFFRPLESASPTELAQALGEVAAATRLLAKQVTSMATGDAPAAKKKAPKVEKRRVSCEYSQLHLEPAERTTEEDQQVFFQDERESAQGMSIFPTKVGIASPSDTELALVSVVNEPRAMDASIAPDAAQAVAFPIAVRGPLVLRSVSDDDGDLEPLAIPPGQYDVLAVFTPPKTKASSKTDHALRRFALSLSFRPAGSLGAPRCLRLEDGSTPPKKIFVNGGRPSATR